MTPPFERRAARPTAEANSLLSRKAIAGHMNVQMLTDVVDFTYGRLGCADALVAAGRPRSDHVHTEATPAPGKIVAGMRELLDARQKC